MLAPNAHWRLPGGLALVVLLVGMALSAASTSAQVPPRFELQVQDSSVSTVLPADGTPVETKVSWVLSCAEVAPAPEKVLPQQAELKLQGTDPPFRIVSSNASVTFPDCVIARASQGQFTLSLAATPGARGEAVHRVGLDVVVPSQAPLPPIKAKSTVSAAIAWQDTLQVLAPVTQAAAGPQKQVVFPIQLHLEGNALAMVHFEIVGDVPAGWIPVAPATTVIDPATGDRTASFIVSTPHHNGGNDGATDIRLRVWATSVRDETLRTEAIEVPLKAEVHGLYIPGPSPILALLAIAGLAALLRKGRSP